MASHGVRLALLIVPVLVTLGACDDATSPERALALARARWAEHGVVSYSITVTRFCNCLETGPAVVVVVDGEIVSRQLTRNDEAVPAPYADLFPSVEGLFERIEAAQQAGVARLEVRYDPTYGFPTRIEIDHYRPAVDDEVTYEATNLVFPQGTSADDRSP